MLTAKPARPTTTSVTPRGTARAPRTAPARRPAPPTPEPFGPPAAVVAAGLPALRGWLEEQLAIIFPRGRYATLRLVPDGGLCHQQVAIQLALVKAGAGRPDAAGARPGGDEPILHGRPPAPADPGRLAGLRAWLDQATTALYPEFSFGSVSVFFGDSVRDPSDSFIFKPAPVGRRG